MRIYGNDLKKTYFGRLINKVSKIYGIDFQKHELSLFVMNLWSLHGNSCLILNNDYHECAPL